MRKLVVLVLATLLCLGVVGCGGGGSTVDYRAEIDALLEKYADTFDEKDWDDFSMLFTDPCKMGDIMVTREELADALYLWFLGYDIADVRLDNLSVTISAPYATAVFDLLYLEDGLPTRAGQVLKLQRLSGKWFITELQGIEGRSASLKPSFSKDKLDEVIEYFFDPK